MATPPAALATKIVADRIRLTDTTQPPSKLAGVEVEIVPGGYRVTKKYEDYSSVLPDGRPRYLWEITTFVSEADVKVKAPDRLQPPVGTPPPPDLRDPVTRQTVKTDSGTKDIPAKAEPPQGGPVRSGGRKPGEPTGDGSVASKPSQGGGSTGSGRDPHVMAETGTRNERPPHDKQELPPTHDPLVIIRPEDISGRTFADPAELARLLRETSDSFSGTVIQDRFSKEFEEAFMDAAGEALLETGKLLPIVGTVVQGGETFHNQYRKTYEGLVQAGIDPATAHKDALLQAFVVTGVSVATDQITGSLWGRFKSVASKPILISALRDKKWKKENVRILAGVLDQTFDAGSVVALATLQQAGQNQTPTPQPLSYRDIRNGGVYFLVP